MKPFRLFILGAFLLGLFDRNAFAGPISVKSINRYGSTPTNATTVFWVVTFSAKVKNVTASNFSLSPATSGSSIVNLYDFGQWWGVAATTGSGDGTLQLNMVNDTGINKNISNLPVSGQAFTIDKTPPSVSFSSPSSAFANTGPITYTVSYADPNFAISTLAAANVTLNKTGTANGTVSVTGSGNTRTVTISSITGNGTLGISIAAGTASDLAGNSALAAGPSSTFTVDNVAPTVAIGSPTSNFVSAGPVAYTITYADANFSSSTLTAAAVTLNKTGTASGSVSVTGSGNTRTVTISGITGNGSLGISLPAGTGADMAGNLAPAAGPSATVAVDTVAPTVTIGAPSQTITTSGPVTFAVSYSDVNFSACTLTPANVTLNKSGSANGIVAVSGSGTTRTVTISSITGNGTLGISLAAGTASDLAGNLASSSTSATFAVDNSAPSVTISSPSSTQVKTGPVTFTVTYNDANFSASTLTSANVTLNKTGTANGTVNVSGSGTTRTVTISSITGDGSLGISLASGSASDLVGNLAPAAGPSATFTVDNTAPTVSIGPPSSLQAKNGPVTYAITFADANFNTSTLSAANVTVNTTGSATAAVGVTGSGVNYTVTLSSLSGNGTLGISLSAGTATDLAGNSAAPSGPSSTFTVDNTAPTITISAPSTTITRSDPVTFTVTYADANFSASTLTAASVTLNTTGTAAGIVNVTGNGSTRTVTISSISGNGSLGISVATDTATDLAGNLASSAGPSATFNVDNTAPTLTIGTSSSSFAAGGPITYAVTYADASFSASTLTAANVTLNATGTAAGTASVTGSGTAYTVTISSITGNGTLSISIPAGTATDSAGNSAPAATGAAFTVDNTAPIVTISSPSVAIAKSGPVTYTVTYTDANFNGSTLSLPNVSLNKTGTANATIGLSGSSSSYTVTLTSITGDGTLGITIAAGTATDRSGNLAPTATSATFAVDTTAPTVTIGTPSNNFPNTGPVTFAVTYADANFLASTLSSGDITLNKTGTADGSVSVTGSGNSRVVTVFSITGNGSLSISIAAGTGVDLAGNLAPAFGPSAPFTVDNLVPNITIGAPSASFASSGPVTYSVTYSDIYLSAISLTAANVTLNTTGTATGTVTVGGTGNTRLVTISNISGNGTANISISAGTATDLTGNSAPAAGSASFTVDNTSPTLSIGAPSSALARTGPVTYTLTYADVNFNTCTLGAANVTLNKTGTAIGTVAVSGNGSTRTVTISGITGDGTLGISIASGSATDFAGNLAPTGTSPTFTVDNTAPSVTISAPSKGTTASSSVTYSATYADANFDASTLTPGDVTLNTTGTASGVVSITGSGNTRTVTISAINGNGTLGISLSAATATDLAGNAAAATGPSATFQVDNTAPTVTVSAPSASVTATGPVTYSVTYSDANFNSSALTAANISLNSTETAAGTVGVAGSGTSYTVSISAITGSGSLGISIASGTATDLAGNSAPAVASSSFSVDNATPIVTIGSPSASFASSGPVTYAVTYSPANFNACTLSLANITLNKTGTANGTVSVAGNGNTRTVSISSITGNGTLGISLAAGTATYLTGNLSPSAGPSALFTVDNIPPTIAIGVPSSSFASTGPVTFAVTYTDVNLGTCTLSPSNITLDKSGTADGTINVSGSAPNYLVTISSITGNGTLGISIGAGTATDLAGNLAPAISPSTTFTVDNIAPSVSISAPSKIITANGPVSYTITYTDANFNASTLTAANVSLVSTGTANGAIDVTGTGNSCTVTVSSVTGNGSLGISLAASTASDLADNLAPATGPSGTFLVDNIVPSVAISPPSASFANTGPITYNVSYADANFDSSALAASAITLNTTETASGTLAVSGGGTSYTITISNITGNGTLGFTIPVGTAIDLAGNVSPAPTSAAFTVDNIAPTVLIGAPSSTFVTAGSITYSVTYADAHFNSSLLAPANINLNTTGTATGSLSVAGSGNTRTVMVSNITGNGTLDISIAGGTATDLAGNSAPAAGPSPSVTVNNTAPSVSIGSPDRTFATTGPVTYTVTFSDANFNVGTLTPANVTLNATGTATGTISVSGNGFSFMVAISNITGDGTLGISIPGGLATDLAGNSTPGAASSIFTVDNTIPAVVIGPPSNSVVNGGSVTFPITYTDLNFGGSTLTVTNVTLNRTGTADGIVALSGSGTNWTATVSGITGDGTLGISLEADTAEDLAGNLAPAITSATFAVDNIAPTLVIGSPSATIATNGPVVYPVTYADARFNASTLTGGDVTLNKTGTANGTVSVAGSGTTFTVTISNITGDGTLGISVASGTATDLAGNLAPASGPSATFTVDNTTPSVIIGGPSKTITTTGPVTYVVSYADTNFGASTLTAAGVTLNKTGTANGTVSIAGSGTTFTVTISNITGDGTLGISVASGTATDLVGNLAPASGPSATFTADNTTPSVIIGGPSKTITTTGPVTYVVSYADTNFGASTLTAAGVTLNKTGTANGTVSVAGSGTTFSATISNITGDGTLGISVASGTATDLVGNLAPANGPSSTFTVDNTNPSITIGGPSKTITTTGPVTYVVSYADSNFGASTLTASDVTLNKIGTASGTLTVTGNGTTFSATISNITGDGTLGISVASGTATDVTGNLVSASGPSATFVVDNTTPSITIGGPSKTITTTGPVTYVVSYADSNFGASTLTASDVTLNKTGTANGIVSVSGSGTTFSVTVSNITGDGTLGISVTSSTATDLVGNLVSASGPSATFTVDNTAPSISIGGPSKAITTTGPVTYVVSYADTNFGASTLTAADVTLNKTGSANGTVSVSGSGTTFSVAVSNITGDGTLGISVTSSTATDLVGNLALASGPSATFTVDNTTPSIIIGGPSKTITTTGPVTYVVSYADSNFGASTLTSADVTLNKTGTANGTVSVAGSGTTLSVTVSNITGDGTLGISVTSSTATDLVGNLVSASGPSATFVVDNTNPSITIGGPSKTITTTGPVTYVVSYADSNFGASTLTASDIILNKTGTANGTVSVAGSGTTFSATISNITGDGTLGISVASGTATDVTGNLVSASGPSATFVVDNTTPSITIGGPSKTITTTGPVTYVVSYADSNFGASTLNASDVILNRTGTANGTVNVAGSGSTFSATISNISGDGTLGISVGSGTATDLVGNLVSASGPSATFTVDNTAPSISIGGPSKTITTTGPVTYVVSYADTNFGASTLTAADVTLNKIGTANGTVNVAGSGTTFTVTISNIIGDGTLGISVAPSTATDLAGNVVLASGSSATFLVDNTAPKLVFGPPSKTITSTDSVSYVVNYSDANSVLSTLSAADITLEKTGTANGSIGVSGSGTNRIVTISGISGDGTLGIWAVPGTGVDSADNPAAQATSAIFIVDNTAPSLTISAPSAQVTAGGAVSYTATYTDTNLGATTLSLANVILNKTGTASGNVSVTGSGASYTITVSNITGNGTLGISVAPSTASDLAGNSAREATSLTFIVDRSTPTISISAPSRTITASGTVAYTVSYNDAYLNISTLSPGNITLNKTGTANGSVSVAGGGTSYVVTISNITGDGTLGISLAAGTATDQAGNLAPAFGPSLTFEVDNTAPVVGINPPSARTTKSGPVTYLVTNIDANPGATTLTAANIILNRTGTANGTLSIAGSSTNQMVVVSDITGDGTLGISIASGTATDAAGNLSASVTSTIFTVDNTPPVVTISSPSAPITSSAAVNFKVAYADANFGASVLSISNVVVMKTGTANGTLGVTGSGTNYTITVSSITGDGNIGISLAAGTATDLAGNVAPEVASATFKVDNTAPMVVISAPSTLFTAVGPVTYVVSDVDANLESSALTPGNVVLNKTGTANGTVSVVGAGENYTITVANITGDGTLSISLGIGTAKDLAGNLAPAVGTTTPVIVDNTAPTVTISRPSTSVTSSGPVVYTVSYSDVNFSASTLAAADVTLVKSGTAAGVVGVTGAGTTRTVTISNITGDGTLSISLPAGTATDLAGNIAPAVSSGFPFSVDHSIPTLAISAPSSPITRLGPVSYTVSYFDPFNPGSAMTGFDSNRILLSATGTANGTVGVTGSGGTRTVTISNITGDGAMSIAIEAGAAADLAGHLTPAVTSVPFLVDDLAPTATMGAPSASITSAGPVSYVVGYLDPNINGTTLTAGDVALNKTGTANGTIGVTGSGTNYIATISNITGDGTLSISIGAATATDLAGNKASAIGPSASFTVDNTVPAVAISAPSATYTASTPVTYSVAYADSHFNASTLSAAKVTLNKSGTANGKVIVTGAGVSYTVAISDITGNGFLGISIAGGTAADLVGNLAPPSGPSATFVVANNSAVPSISAPSTMITTSGPATFTIGYPEGAINSNTPTAANVELNKTGTANANVSVSNTGTNCTVTLSNITGDGTLSISLAAGTFIDLAGNPVPELTSGALTVDNIAPIVAISAPSATVSNGDQVTFSVSYSDVHFSASALTAANVTLNKTGTATGTVSVTGGGTGYYVTVSNITGDGTLGISIQSGTASDLAGHIAAASAASLTFQVTSPPIKIKPSDIAPPTIVSLPLNQTIPLGSNAVFTVAALGTPPLSYQWLFNGTNISGATEAALVVSNVQPANVGLYQVAVVNAAGITLSESVSLRLALQPPIAINELPKIQISTNGASVALSVSPIGVGLNLQWQRLGVDLPGATNATLTLDNTQNIDIGDYTVLLSHTSVGLSLPLALLSADASVGILIQPNIQGIGIGSSPNLSVTAGASGNLSLNYQWLLNGAEIPGATNATLDLPTVPSVLDSIYQVELRSSIGNLLSSPVDLKARSEFGTVVINDTTWDKLVSPTIVASPQNVAATAGGTVSLGVAAIGAGPFTYQWTLNGTNIQGAVNSTLVLTNVQQADAGEYLVLVSNPSGSTYSDEAFLQITGAAPLTLAVRSSDTGSLAIELTGTSNQALELQASTNLINWITLTNLTSTIGTTRSFNTFATGDPSWFYRVVAVPSLKLTSISHLPNGNVALQATGPWGQTFELQATIDYTNWVALTNLTFTGGVANCLDTSAGNYDQRYYRMVAEIPFTLVSETPHTEVLSRLLIQGTPGHRVVVQGSTDLVNWTPIGTNYLAAPNLELIDASSTNTNARFYRVGPERSPDPSFRLSVGRATADGAIPIQLAGPKGRSVELQASINLEEWQGLTTLLMENGDGNYLDTSASNGNHRFYRGVIAPPLKILSTSRLPGGQYQLLIQGTPGHSITIQSSEDLLNWTPVAIRLMSGGTNLVFVDDAPAATSSARIYRAVAAP